MAKRRQRKHRRDRTPDEEATTPPSLHERLAVTRVRVNEALIKLRGEEEAEKRRLDDLDRLKDEDRGARSRLGFDKGRRKRKGPDACVVPPDVLCGDFQKLRQYNPNWPKTKIWKEVAKKRGVSWWTVRRHTLDLT